MSKRVLNFWQRILLVLIASTFVFAQHTVFDSFLTISEPRARESIDDDRQTDVRHFQPFLFSLHGADGHVQVARAARTLPASYALFLVSAVCSDAAKGDVQCCPLTYLYALHNVPLWLQLRQLLR